MKCEFMKVVFWWVGGYITNRLKPVETYRNNSKVVLGIPQYVLVNPEGKIINYNCPHPSNPELKILLNNLLKVQK
ncbi:MAG: hypothetical protein ABIP35_05520 [Ginsengibacter sp.]